MTDVFAESTLCVPGKQDMNGILVKSFYTVNQTEF